MLRVIVGTAGHIDHGKTELVRALTGVDCDRWAEEKERGITIDLGFAHLAEEDLQVGFIDVPGHQRFLHNALAGLGGIRILLLVVAADEGVMPQTREHIAICSLLAIPSALVVLTKKDLAPDDVLELAELELQELLEDTPFADAPVHQVSSLTGEGIAELRQAILDLGRRQAVQVADHDPARLPIDRAFHLKGLGVIATGTLASGQVRPGDALELMPSGQAVRVRSVQVHGQAREVAAAGERTSLQLTGVDLDELSRGLQLTTPGIFEGSRILAARLRLLPDAPDAIEGTTPIRLHLYSSEVIGRLRPLDGKALEPGEEGLVELRLAAPVNAIRGDRFIIRRPSPLTTLGGGDILDPRWRRRRKAEIAASLEGLVGDRASAIESWARGERERGIATEQISRRLGVPASAVVAELRQLAEQERLIEVPNSSDLWLDPACIAGVETRARKVLAAYFAKDRLARGIPKAEAIRRILPASPPPLVQYLLDLLTERNIVEVDGRLLRQPGRRVELAGAEAEIAARLVEEAEAAGLAANSAEGLALIVGGAGEAFDAALRFVIDEGQVVRLPGGLIVAEKTLEALRQDLAASGWERFSVPDFKDRFDLTRKLALPLLEHLDSSGFTRRVGDERILVSSP
ncbi:MAG: selenocysteine-specific translation elongation factor [Acidobacteriota bacterium]